MLALKKRTFIFSKVEIYSSYRGEKQKLEFFSLKKSEIFVTDRAMSNQICDVRTKFDILYAFVNVSLCLTHRKHSIQCVLDSPGSGERFKYVERARKVYRKFFRDI